MKTKLLLQMPAVILILIASLSTAPGQPAPQRATVINPATGLPVPANEPIINPATGLPAPSVASALIDPTTGMLLAPPQPEPQWIDPGWTDPNIVLTNVSYDGLLLSEVARDLRERFKNYFDILPMPRTFDRDWGGEIAIQLQLENVKASEVFNAMNLVFENDHTPIRWELKMNGNRPVALLRVLPEAAPQPAPSSSRTADIHRMVFFIGNLLGDEKSGGMTMDQIIKTISDVWPADFGKPAGVIQFHNEAQLLVINGTREQIDFIQQTLNALRQKVAEERSKQTDASVQMRLDQMRQKELERMQITPKAGRAGGQ